jgi:hypothetical protein
MPHRTTSTVTVGTMIAALAVVVTAGDASARSSKPRPVVVVHPVPPPPYAPYYYSPWNPYSIYSIYDHLSGGREQCQLPTEPCDNQHRVQN